MPTITKKLDATISYKRNSYCDNCKYMIPQELDILDHIRCYCCGLYNKGLSYIMVVDNNTHLATKTLYLRCEECVKEFGSVDDYIVIESENNV